MAKRASADSIDTVHDRALAQFRFVAEIETPQRPSEREALKFEAGDQWPEDAKVSRAGLPANAGLGTPAVPARPMLTMRTLDQPIAQIRSMARDADLGIKIIPKDGEAKKETAEVLQGLCRAIEADSHAQGGAYAWGFQRMSACGRGYWRVNKYFADDETGLDQVLRIDPIENGFTVYLDPMPSWQQGGGFWEPEWGFITQDVSEAAYKREYGESDLAQASKTDIFTALGDNAKDWVMDGEAGCYYRIAEYFWAVYDKVTIAETITDPETGEQIKQAREVLKRKIMWGKLNGMEWLDKTPQGDGQQQPI